MFGIQEFNTNKIEDPWFNESNATYEEYNEVSAYFIAKTMCFYNDKLENMSKETQFLLIQNYSMKKGIKKIGKQGKYSAAEEMKHLHDRVVFEPISRTYFTEQEKIEPWRASYS